MYVLFNQSFCICNTALLRAYGGTIPIMKKKKKKYNSVINVNVVFGWSDVQWVEFHVLRNLDLFHFKYFWFRKTKSILVVCGRSFHSCVIFSCSLMDKSNIPMYSVGCRLNELYEIMLIISKFTIFTICFGISCLTLIFVRF